MSSKTSARFTGVIAGAIDGSGGSFRLQRRESEWCSRASGLPRRYTAINRASTTNWLVMVGLTDQPTTLREKAFTTPRR